VRLNRARIPAGGWHFPVAEGVVLKAATEDLLKVQIFEFRLRNNLPQGELEREIDAYFCASYPSMCNKEPHEYGNTKTAPVDESLLNRVARWASAMLHGMPKGGYPLVAKSEAEQRAVRCIGCPKNTVWRTGCRGCSSSTVSVLSQVKSMKRLPQDGSLYGCSAAGWDNSTACWQEKDRLQLSDERRAQLDSRCWLIS
jgi:hypothetical protein